MRAMPLVIGLLTKQEIEKHGGARQSQDKARDQGFETTF